MLSADHAMWENARAIAAYLTARVTSSTSHLLDRTWTRSPTIGRHFDADISMVTASRLEDPN